MKAIPLAAGVFLLVAVPASAGMQDLRTSLKDTAHTGYFDAHTHWPGGILPWKAFGKMLNGFQDPRDQALLDKTVLTEPEYARLVEIYQTLFNEIATALRTEARLRDSPRVSPAARAVAALTFPANPVGQAAKTKKLQDLEEALRRLVDFDNYVVIRFGHVSHATREHARRMAAAKIWADVNLTSNIATGTLYLDRPDLSRPNLLRYFEDHALVDLIAEDVKVVFGSDGPGVEHVRMANELVIAETDIFGRVPAKVLDKRRKSMAGKAKQYVDQMLANARAHVAFVEGSPGPPRP